MKRNISVTVCQAHKQPIRDLSVRRREMPVPMAAGDLVALHQFMMPQVKHDGNTYDCFVLAVDGYSGYTVVVPAMRKGFTGAKAAKMMISEWVGLF